MKSLVNQLKDLAEDIQMLVTAEMIMTRLVMHMNKLPFKINMKMAQDENVKIAIVESFLEDVIKREWKDFKETRDILPSTDKVFDDALAHVMENINKIEFVYFDNIDKNQEDAIYENCDEKIH